MATINFAEPLYISQDDAVILTIEKHSYQRAKHYKFEENSSEKLNEFN